MIKKTIIAAVILFIGYNLFLVFIHPLAGNGQQQWQKNRILIENYVDDAQNDSVVIVGTSLSARLYPVLLPGGFYNLALAGESVLDGLSIVKQAAKKPKYVLIETNLYYKSPDKDLGEGVFSPLNLQLRKWIPSFREENQPANLLVPLFSKAPKAENKMDGSILNTLLRQRIADYQKVPDSTDMEHSLSLLKQDIATLQSQGVKVILYEIPIHCKLYTTPKYIIPKQKLLRAFPASAYHWLSAADCGAYSYNDGEHMDFQSAAKFADWFVKGIKGF